MNYDFILFSLFASLSIISAIMVISLSNAVHSVLFLIFLFCNIASLLLLLGSEFLSLLFLIVYVGAIAVLFLFVVMMLNLTVEPNLLKTHSMILPIGFLIGLALTLQFVSCVNTNFAHNTLSTLDWTLWILESYSYSNTKVLGLVLYTKYSLLFLMCSLILLVSMIGVIVLTIHQKMKLKKQDINIQICRNPKKTIKFSSLN